MINNYNERVKFLTHFITVVINEKVSYQDLQDKIKDFPSQTLPIYNEIIKINDEELFNFLQGASIPLLRIDKIENYLRSVDTKNIDTTQSTKIKSYESLEELTEGIDSFNKNIQGYTIHLPYLDLSEIINKEEIHLKSFWYELSGAKLSEASLSGASLSEADLSGAKLTWAKLSGAKRFSLNNN